MYYIFKIAGFQAQPFPFEDGTQIIPGGQLKQQARRASHRVHGCDELVGPKVRFEYYEKPYLRHLTRREVVFGVKAPKHGDGGFAGLVAWCGYEGTDHTPEIHIDMVRASMARAEEWTIDFVRDIIRVAGWTILEEGESHE